MEQAELCEHCQFVASTISVSPHQATTVELVTRKQACEKRWFAYVQKRAGDSFSREASVSHTDVETITELDQGYLLSRKIHIPQCGHTMGVRSREHCTTAVLQANERIFVTSDV